MTENLIEIDMYSVIKQKYIERDVLDKIRAEITAIAINGQVNEHTAFIRTGEQVKQMALEIINKHISGKEITTKLQLN